MTFREPQLLWLLAATPLLLVFLLWRESVRTTRSRLLVSERLRGLRNPARVLRPWLLTVATVAGVIALAGPSLGYQVIPVTARETNRVIAIDLSQSMAAGDAGTSRFDAGRILIRMLTANHSGRIALIGFESRPELISPLTNDAEALITLLDSLQPGDLDAPGSDLGAAIEAALKIASADRGQNADIILISDGEDQGLRLGSALADAKARGVAVSTICVGSAAGSAIPTGGGSLRDENGTIVITRARPDVLRDIAAKTGGAFLDNPPADRVAMSLGTLGDASSRSRQMRLPIERYQWPLAIAFFAFILSSAALRGAE